MDGAGHPLFFRFRTRNQQKYGPIPERIRAGTLESRDIESTAFDPLALRRLGGRLLFLPETSDDDTENAEDIAVLVRGDSTCISEPATLYTSTKPSRNSHKGQFRDKSACTFDSDDMSLFTSTESLLYGQFPNSFMSIVDEDDES